jgi:WD40 repeat protein
MRFCKVLVVAAFCGPSIAADLALVPQEGHAAEITALAATRDGARILSGAGDGSLHIVQGSTDRVAVVIAAHAGAVRSIALSPEGNRFATVGDDRYLRVWEWPDKLLWEQSIGETATPAAAWSGDGKWIVTSGPKLRCFPADGGAPAPLEIENPSVLAFAPGTNRLAVATLSGEVRVLDLTDPRQPRPVVTLRPEGSVRGMLLGTGTLAVVANGVEMWDVARGVRTATIPAANFPVLAWVEPEKSFAVGAGSPLRVYSWEANPQLRYEKKTEDQITAIAAASGAVYAGGFTGKLFGAKADDLRVVSEPAGARIVSVEFSPGGSLDVISSGGTGITIGSFDALRPQVTIRAGYLAAEAARPLNGGQWIAALLSSQLLLLDRVTSKPIAQLPTGSIENWPLTCDNVSSCAWPVQESGTGVRVADFQNAASAWTIPLGANPVLTLGLRGDVLIASANSPELMVWSRSRKTLSASIRLRVPSGERIDAGLMHGKLFLPEPGRVTASAVSADGARVAAGNAAEVVICKPTGMDCARSEVSAAPSAMAFGGRTLLWVDRRRNLTTWDRAAGVGPRVAGPRVVGQVAALATEVTVSPDERFAAILLDDGLVELWDLKAGQLRLRLMQSADRWLAVSPTGFFDGNEAGWRSAVWRVGEALTPVEAFVEQFFRPDLVSDTLAGRSLPVQTLPPLRKLPQVALRLVEKKPGEVRVSLHADAGEAGSRIAGVRLSRNDIVIRSFAGPWTTDREVTVQIPPGPAEVRAWAFDEKGMKSEDVVLPLPMEGFGYQMVRPVLRVVAVGIDKYRNERFNLRFAKADADLLAQALGKTPSEWNALQPRANDLFNEGMFQGARPEEDLPQSTEIISLPDEKATRANILAALAEVIRKSSPQDAILFWFAGHGAAVGDRYVLLPHDAEVSGSPSQLDARSAAALLRSGVTDLDLEKALGEVDVRFLGIVLDSCQSGKLLEGDRPRGPLNGSGFAHLVYEKGIYLLAASQSFESALEDNTCGHGLLSCALLVDGLGKGLADFSPKDGRIDLAEWFRYGALRVPELAQPGGDPTRGSITPGAAQGKARSIQTPRFVPRAFPERAKLLVGVEK